MGRYVNPGNEGFARLLLTKYVDKTELILQFNSTLNTADGLVMVSRPRLRRARPACWRNI